MHRRVRTTWAAAVALRGRRLETRLLLVLLAAACGLGGAGESPAASTSHRYYSPFGVTWVGASFSPDGRQLATVGGVDGTAQVWEAASGRLLFTLRHGEEDRL